MEAHEFIVGKWYKHKNGYYAKFSKFTKGLDNQPNCYFHWSEWLDKNLNHEYYNGNWYRTDVVEEADMSVIACKLPYTVELELNYQIF